MVWCGVVWAALLASLMLHPVNLQAQLEQFQELNETVAAELREDGCGALAADKDAV